MSDAGVTKSAAAALLWIKPVISTLPPRIVPLPSASNAETSITATAPCPADGVQVAAHLPEPALDSTSEGSLLENVATTDDPFPVSTGVPQLSEIAT